MCIDYFQDPVLYLLFFLFFLREVGLPCFCAGWGMRWLLAFLFNVT